MLAVPKGGGHGVLEHRGSSQRAESQKKQGESTAQSPHCAFHRKGRARQQLRVSEVRAGRSQQCRRALGCSSGFLSSAWPWCVTGRRGVGQECRAR